MKKLIFVLIFLIILPVLTSTAITPQIILSHFQVTIRVTEGQTGPIMAEMPVRVLVKSDLKDWSVHYHATPLRNEKGETISPSQLLIQTPYTRNFESLDIPRMVGKGSFTGAKTEEIGNIMIGFNSTGFEKPGIYEGQIVSPDGGPTMFLKVIIQPMPVEFERPFIGHKPKPKKSYITVNPDKLRFLITGPGDFPADNPVNITVIGKSDFVVKIHITPLVGEKGTIPPNRIYVNMGNGNYYSLDKPVIVLTGKEKNIGKKERVSTQLYFKLKATSEDKAGEYKGEIIVTYEPDMEEGGDLF
ncbi:MAG: hypothetical protein N2202_04210 [Proteobacteria bacterium]|nr:hypothetical protein [Pseudomonadota bacterium]